MSRRGAGVLRVKTRGVDPRILREPNRVRYLKVIAVFKMLKGVLLLCLGVSLLFLKSRPVWLDAISDWANDELLIVHNRTLIYLLNRLQDMLAGEQLHATGLLALFYAAVLFTEGIGVYLQKRWAEFLMVFATAGLIPLEIRHLWHKPSVAATIILVVNCFIVWFLYAVLRREKRHSPKAPVPEVAQSR